LFLKWLQNLSPRFLREILRHERRYLLYGFSLTRGEGGGGEVNSNDSKKSWSSLFILSLWGTTCPIISHLSLHRSMKMQHELSAGSGNSSASLRESSLILTSVCTTERLFSLEMPTGTESCPACWGYKGSRARDGCLLLTGPELA